MAVGTGLIHQEVRFNLGLRAAAAVLVAVVARAEVAAVLPGMRVLGATVAYLAQRVLRLEQAVVVVVVVLLLLFVVALVLGVEAGHLR